MSETAAPSPTPEPSFVCPHKGEPGYVSARRLRLPPHGWVVLYDRRKGCPPGMSKIAWDDATRFVVMFRPEVGGGGKVKFKTVMDMEIAKDVLKWAAKGCDMLELWGGQPVPDVFSAVSHAHAHNARAGVRAPAQDEAPPAKPAEVRPPAPSFAKAGKPVPLAIQVKARMVEQITVDMVVQSIKEGLEAIKVVSVGGGNCVEMPDHAAREKAREDWLKYQLGMAAKEKELQEQKTLDDDHLEQLILTCAEFREELKAMIAEAEKGTPVTTGIPGDKKP